MSRKRERVDVLPLYDEAGRKYQEERSVIKEPWGLTDIPVAQRDVEIYDEAEHLVGILVFTGSETPGVVYAQRRTGPYVHLILSSGLVEAAVAGRQVFVVGSPSAAATIRCSSCRSEFVVEAAELTLAKSRKRRGKIPRVVARVA